MRASSARGRVSSQASGASAAAPPEGNGPRGRAACGGQSTAPEAGRERLVRWSIDHSWLIVGLALLLLGAGGWTARQMPIDVFPDLTAPPVTILAEGHGMAPEEMESLVTF